MMGPSPDWNVGLSAEDLCTKECGWVQRVVQDLIPWDAGTDSGVSYEVGVPAVMERSPVHTHTHAHTHTRTRTAVLPVRGVIFSALHK